MPAHKYRCPKGQQKAGVDILYGMPSVEAFEMAERGEIVLGGCCIEPDSPERQCTACGHQWRIQGRQPLNVGGQIDRPAHLTE